MVCPNCGKEMKYSNITISTYPPTDHVYCDCGLVLDVCSGKMHVCFQSRLSKEDKDRIALLLQRNVNLNFIPTGEDNLG
jgi:hypothetical protein